MMKTLRVILWVCLLTAAAEAQQTPITFRITTDPPNLTFRVDGVTYRNSALFLWTPGSKHTLAVLAVQLADGGVTVDDFQTRYVFDSWQGPAEFIPNPQFDTQVITADPKYTSLVVKFKKQSKVVFQYVTPPVEGAEPIFCPPYPELPADPSVPGEAYFAGACYQGSWVQWIEVGQTYSLSATAFPGYVFLGWSVNGAPPNPFLYSIQITGPVHIVPVFARAKRVKFVTSPPGLDLVIDQQLIRTPQPYSVCNVSVREICPGELDWAVPSTHTLAAVSPQESEALGIVVFDQWDVGGGQNTSYTVNDYTAETITAKFVPAVSVGILTEPHGLKLNVDGVLSERRGNVYWGIGTKHTVSAPEQQTGNDGRKYVFRAWSNNGAREQEVTVNTESLGPNYRLVAMYDRLARLTVKSNVQGATVWVDGAECKTPCVIEKPAGSSVTLRPGAEFETGEGIKAKFNRWYDGSEAMRRYEFTDTEARELSMEFLVHYRVFAAVNPEQGAELVLEPSSPDGYYAAGSTLNVEAHVKQGYKFRRWSGDAEGVSSTVTLAVNRPLTILANLDKVNQILPAAVVNAAGQTPEQAVSAGSLISIYGEELTGGTEAASPGGFLLQTLAGVSVKLGNDTLLPLLFVSPTQINALVPSTLPEGTYPLQVLRENLPDVPGEVKVVRNNPGWFTTVDPANPESGEIIALALHSDYSHVSSAKPARPGETLILYGTGMGPYQRSLIDGFPAPAEPLNPLADTVEVVAGGQAYPVVWAGAAPNMIGVQQINFKVPQTMPRGSKVPVAFRVNGKTGNTVHLPVE